MEEHFRRIRSQHTSHVLTVPISIIKALDITPGQTVKIRLEDKSIVITPLDREPASQDKYEKAFDKMMEEPEAKAPKAGKPKPKKTDLERLAIK